MIGSCWNVDVSSGSALPAKCMTVGSTGGATVPYESRSVATETQSLDLDIENV